jgi:hypothetical protein
MGDRRDNRSFRWLVNYLGCRQGSSGSLTALQWTELLRLFRGSFQVFDVPVLLATVDSTCRPVSGTVRKLPRSAVTYRADRVRASLGDDHSRGDRAPYRAR